MKKIIFIGIIFCLFCFFRFKNIDKRIGFGWDQEQYTTQVKQLVKEHKPVLIGPRVNNDKGFFLAPYFTYVITPFYLTTNLHPMAILYFLIFFNILFFFAAYFFIKSIFNEKVALIFLLLWSINPVLTGYDTISWWPIWIPLGVIATWWILYRLYNSLSTIWWIALGLTLGFFFNMHFQFILIVLFSCVLIFSILKNKKIRLVNLLFLVFSFALTFIPLLIFDLRHNFLNIKLFFGFITQSGGGLEADYLAWLPVFNNLIKPLAYFSSNYITALFYVVALIAICLLYKKKKGFYKFFYFSALFLWLAFPIIFAKYGRRPSEYYFIFLYPFIYIFLIDFMSYLPKKIFAMFFIVFVPVFFLLNRSPLFDRLKPDFYSLYYMDKLVKDFAPFTKDKKFNIAFDVPTGGDSGYRYLFTYYKISQTGDWNDPLIRLIRPSTNECQYKSEAGGIIIPPELQ